MDSALNSRVTNPDWRKTFPKDLLASVAVFLTALPLSMGIAIASGLPPVAGLLTGIIGGIVVAPLAGAPLLVSGPAAGLAVVMLEIAQRHGMDKMAVAILLAGVIQILAGALRLGQWFRAVSPAVVGGMLSGIGILIAAAQFHVMLDDPPKANGIANILAIPSAIANCIEVVEGDYSHIAASIGVLTITVLVFWEKFAPKKLKIIPSALLAVTTASVVTAIFGLTIHKVSLPSNLLSAITPTTFDQLKLLDWRLVQDAIFIALIASAETLLSATAIDRLHQGQRTKYDRELLAQGLGNTICGFIGSLPMTGVIVRSSVNVNSGACTRASATMHGLWLLLFVAFLPGPLQMVPTAGLAALLVYTGFKLIDIGGVKQLATYSRSEAAIRLITMLVIVCTDLLTGVIVGLVLSAAKLLYVFSHLVIETSSPQPGTTLLQLRGTANFLNLPRLASALESVPGDTELHLRLDGLDYIDHASLDLLMNWEAQHKAAGGSLVIDWGALGAMYRDRRRNRVSGSAPEASAAAPIPLPAAQPPSPHR